LSLIPLLLSLLFYCPPAHPALHSFPTRRSSDLQPERPVGRAVGGVAEDGRAVGDVELGRGRDDALREHDARDVHRGGRVAIVVRSEEHTSELQSLAYLVCRLLLEKKKKKNQ